MPLGEVTLGLPWRRVFQWCLHQDTSLCCFSSVAEPLDAEGRKSCPKLRHTPKGKKALAPGRLSKPFLSADLRVPFVHKETHLGTAVVSEPAVKVRRRRGRVERAWRPGIWDWLLPLVLKSRGVCFELSLWCGGWPLLPAFWVLKRGDISVATNRLEKAFDSNIWLDSRTLNSPGIRFMSSQAVMLTHECHALYGRTQHGCFSQGAIFMWPGQVPTQLETQLRLPFLMAFSLRTDSCPKEAGSVSDKWCLMVDVSVSNKPSFIVC